VSWESISNAILFGRSIWRLTVQKFQPLKNVDPEYEVSSTYDCVAATAGREKKTSARYSGRENAETPIMKMSAE
jgi:hypothetical protein